MAGGDEQSDDRRQSVKRFVAFIILACGYGRAGEPLFADDFNRAELGPSWRVGTPEFVIKDGILLANQTKPHSAVGMVRIEARDVLVECRFRMGGARSINAVFNDRDYKEGHAGHIARVSLLPGRIFIADDKERLRHEIEEMSKDPAKKAAAAKLTAGRTKGFPTKIDPAQWHQLQITLIGDELSVSLDGKPVGSLKSSGIAHPVKSDFYFAVSGTDARFDDLRIMNATTR